MRRKSGPDRKIPEEHSWVLQQLSLNALTLSGFSFTSLTFVIGFLGKAYSPSLVSGLLFCTIAFAVAGEMARTSYSLEEYIVAETLYFISLVLLFYDFITLTYESLQSWGIVPILVAVAGMLYIVWRTFANYKLLKSVLV